MAEINETTRFNADQINNLIVGVAAQVGKHDAGVHRHRKHQLLFASSGCMSIRLDGFWCVLPPSRAAWIPSGTEHSAVMRNVVAYRSLYVDRSVSSSLPQEIRIFAVNGLLRELIERMAYWEWDKSIEEQQTILSLFCEELNTAEPEYFSLKLPTDRRLSDWLTDVMEGKRLPEHLIDMATHIGASAKTISRIFTRETGMPYQSWRQQWRLQAAIERLSEGTRVCEVADSLSFSSDSAFISFFRKMTGDTPRRYI
ncbi:helix-turn-helix transcriptional regulator [Enterovibrio makurazakiensis]|uniref:Helix-turn-helix transcriptional regulator n=1 Tax=Enterovibrio gelatinilyticus TaxID=2899819 RepID=A0ABT5R2L9_9GAMM|nr:helix-turn-helix transcriptional regulator [Enterovibrio sp. ZSDZ42]MDD1793752.1 helix-turn-helix transcriptional regulator [Enterovibrio sp. ZSDZ42]